ncbi:hypothetical protein PHA51_02765 [Rodentibacter pneumotropicus]|uniref:hypothetical protein n=1 Tax=Rodentibacter pneumotropicus TaxID=758 RepID=UPI00232D57D0|nr:hypothetical protein [Rodentibacter pneumotropicus]MDC2824963.1 hypothetical protein [Rodentibacter pneumotropicus]
MAESYLISQLVKIIESAYKEKEILAHQSAQLEQQKIDLDEKILSFEKTLMLIEPDFDLRRLKTQFNGAKLVQPRLFNQNLQWLISKVLRNNDNEWKNLYWITEDVLKLDNEGKNYFHITKEHKLAVIRVIRTLYKKGIIERKEVELHKLKKKRGFFTRSEWRLKQIENEG